MKCDELKYYCSYRGEVIDINCDEYKDNPKYDTFYIKADVDVAIAELKDHNVQLLSENMELKQKLENVQASMYADVVDANMENRRLKRALWLARARRAKERQRMLPNNKEFYTWQEVERRCSKKAEEYK